MRECPCGCSFIWNVQIAHTYDHTHKKINTIFQVNWQSDIYKNIETELGSNKLSSRPWSKCKWDSFCKGILEGIPHNVPSHAHPLNLNNLLCVPVDNLRPIQGWKSSLPADSVAATLINEYTSSLIAQPCTIESLVVTKAQVLITHCSCGEVT